MGGRGGSSTGGSGGSAGKVERFTVDGNNLTMKTTTTSMQTGTRDKPETFSTTRVQVTRVDKYGERLYVADAEFTHGSYRATLYPRSVNVDPVFQRAGIGTRMYSAAQKATGQKIIASDTQTPQGKAFSAAFRSKQS